TTRMKAWPGPWRRLIAPFRAASAGPRSSKISADLPPADARRSSAALVTGTSAISIEMWARRRFRSSSSPQDAIGSHGNPHRRPQSAHRAVAEHHVAAVRARDITGDGETKAAARFILLAGVVEAQKRLEHVIPPGRLEVGAVGLDPCGHVAGNAVGPVGGCRTAGSPRWTQVG